MHSLMTNISMSFFLQLLDVKMEVKKEHMLSSNLGSLAAVVDILHHCESPAAIFKVIKILDFTLVL